MMWLSGFLGLGKASHMANTCHETSSVISPYQAGPEDCNLCGWMPSPLLVNLFHRRTFKNPERYHKSFWRVLAGSEHVSHRGMGGLMEQL